MQHRSGIFAAPLAGGFEGSCHRRADGTRLDLIAATGHLARAREDYRLLAEHGLGVARDGFRWPLIETAPGQYDWAAVDPLFDAAQATGLQVVWDLLHFGFPDWLNPWHPDTPRRFAAFCHAAAERLDRAGWAAPPVWVPVNEISFLAWAAGQHGHFAPWGEGRGGDFKRQLVRCALAAIDACRAVDPRARFVHADPVIHVQPGAAADGTWPLEAVEAARTKTVQMFEAWDMIAGLRCPELGGAPHYLDILGVNFYQHNQWRLDGTGIGRGTPQWRPFQDLLVELHERYRRPLWISETGAEEPIGREWLDDVIREIGAARRRGADILGCCMYPIMDYFGWDDDRHCPCGLISLDRATLGRRVRPRIGEGIAAALAELSPAGITRAVAGGR